jgi:hypothetical protein
MNWKEFGRKQSSRYYEYLRMSGETAENCDGLVRIVALAKIRTDHLLNINLQRYR